jgi:hypothetical protein
MLEVLLVICFWMVSLVIAAGWLFLFLQMPAEKSEVVSRISGFFGGYIEPSVFQGPAYIEADARRIKVRTLCRYIVFCYVDIQQISFVRFWGQKSLKITPNKAGLPTMMISGYKRDALARFIELHAPELVIQDRSDRNWYE